MKPSLWKLCRKGIVGEKNENMVANQRVLAEFQARDGIGWGWEVGKWEKRSSIFFSFSIFFLIFNFL